MQHRVQTVWRKDASPKEIAQRKEDVQRETGVAIVDFILNSPRFGRHAYRVTIDETERLIWYYVSGELDHVEYTLTATIE